MRRDSFNNCVLRLCSRVPRGRVTTYALIAKKLGSPGAARAVGNALNKNQQLIKIPCHRVVKSGGEIGGYRRGKREKMKLLSNEGVRLYKGKIINFDKIVFNF